MNAGNFKDKAYEMPEYEIRQNLRANKFLNRVGLTIVELLVVMALGSIVASVAFTIYRLNSSTYLKNEADIKLQKNLREAMYYISRDIRMAGNGLFILGPDVKRIYAFVPYNAKRNCGDFNIGGKNDWFSYCDDSKQIGIRPIFGEDGGKARSDIVTIFRAEPEFSGVVGETMSFQNSELTLARPVDKRAIARGDILAIVQKENAALLEVKDLKISGDEIDSIILNLGGRFTDKDRLPINVTAEGAFLYNLKDVTLATYFLDEKTNRLMAVYHDQKALEPFATESVPKVVAEGVEDFQLFYYFQNEKVDPSLATGDPTISGVKLDQTVPIAVSVGITGISTRKLGGPSQVRPALFNRAAGTKKDAYVRTSFMTTIQLRNYEK